jgi:hypothetical protein
LLTFVHPAVHQKIGCPFGLGAIVVAGAIGVVAVLLLSSSNQLAAFQAGLSAVATVAASQPSATAEK